MKRLQFLPLLFVMLVGCGQTDNNTNVDTPKNSEPSNDISFAENFVEGVNNPYFNLVPGRRFYLKGQSPYGINVQRDILATDKTKEILGVSAQGILEREWHDDNLVRVKKKWYAQDEQGNVWLLGQDDYEIFGNYMKSKKDSWFAGENNAKAGIVIPAELQPGEIKSDIFNGFYKQKFEVISVGDSVILPGRSLKNCVKIREYSFLPDEVKEDKVYCTETGNLSLELVPNSLSKIELSTVQDNYPTSGIDADFPELRVDVEEDKAKETALKHVKDATSVKKIALGLWNKKPAYAVEVEKQDGKTVMVYIDIHKGFVLEK